MSTHDLAVFKQQLALATDDELFEIWSREVRFQPRGT